MKSVKWRFLLFSLLICSAIANIGLISATYQPFPKLHFEPHNWTADMKRVKMTTPEMGLKIRIDFTNLDTQNYYTMPYIKIRIETNYEEQANSKDWDYIELRNFGIAPNNVSSTYYDVDLQRSPSSLGRWSVRLGYVLGESAWDFSQQIEPYPLEFRVASGEELQKAIAENPAGFVFSPQITIEFSVLGGVSVAVALFYLKKKKRRG